MAQDEGTMQEQTSDHPEIVTDQDPPELDISTLNQQVPATVDRQPQPTTMETHIPAPPQQVPAKKTESETYLSKVSPIKDELKVRDGGRLWVWLE
jgi:hypothetical protein